MFLVCNRSVCLFSNLSKYRCDEYFCYLCVCPWLVVRPSLSYVHVTLLSSYQLSEILVVYFFATVRVKTVEWSPFFVTERLNL